MLPIDREAGLTPRGGTPPHGLAGNGLPGKDALFAAEGGRPLTESLDEYERVLITRALSVAGGNVAEAARRLQTDRPNLYRRMRRLGISGAGGVGV